jgi:hypothetical protein
MKIFKIPVTWEMCGFVKIEANTIEEAMRFVNEDEYDIELPNVSNYVDGSFALSTTDPEIVKLYQ